MEATMCADEEAVSLPKIRGLRCVEQTTGDGMIVMFMESDDADAEGDIRRLLGIINDPVEGAVLKLSIKPGKAMEAVSHALVSNHCAECCGNTFRREFRTAGSPRRIVDMLYCTNPECKQSMRVDKHGSCEGLAPSLAARTIAEQIGSAFKKVWGSLGDLPDNPDVEDRQGGR